MNLLFLDIDGVLNNTESRRATICAFHAVKYKKQNLEKRHLDIDEDNLKLVFKLIKKYNMKVVISSMWRFNAKLYWFDEMFALYNEYVDDLDFLSVKTMEDWEGCGSRSKGIEEYLKDNPCNSFVCLDDTAKHFSSLHDNLVLTDIDYGFTEQDFLKACEILDKQLLS